jgi:gluconokinase
MTKDCIIALDLGTTAFKCAPVDETGLLAEPTTVLYDLDYHAGLVTCPARRYEQLAAEALAGAVQAAHRAGLAVRAIGISSQAQTYFPLDRTGRPVQDAVVWTDDRAVAEAREVAALIPDFAQHSGFREPLPALFMPKLRHFARHSGIPLSEVWKFALLNEYIIYALTGALYGDTTNQGMSGFYHIREHAWSQVALRFAGIDAGQLADTAPAARLAQPLSAAWHARLGLDAVNVYSCGNDQSCSATGAGLAAAGDVLCNFGTAMVLYALKEELPATLLDKQIAGISPYTGRYFLLGLESECGNVLDWVHRLCYAQEPFTHMMEQALLASVDAQALPRVALPGGGRIELQGLTVGCERAHLVRALLERFAETFGELLAGVRGAGEVPHLFASGGVSRSDAWLHFLSQRLNIQFQRTTTEQPGLVGVARIIQKATQR